MSGYSSFSGGVCACCTPDKMKVLLEVHDGPLKGKGHKIDMGNGLKRYKHSYFPLTLKELAINTILLNDPANFRGAWRDKVPRDIVEWVDSNIWYNWDLKIFFDSPKFSSYIFLLLTEKAQPFTINS